MGRSLEEIMDDELTFVQGEANRIGTMIDPEDPDATVQAFFLSAALISVNSALGEVIDSLERLALDSSQAHKQASLDAYHRYVKTRSIYEAGLDLFFDKVPS